MNKIYFKLITPLSIIFILFLTLAYTYAKQNTPEFDLSKAKECNNDSDCTIVQETSACSCHYHVAINKEFKDRWKISQKEWDKECKQDNYKHVPSCQLEYWSDKYTLQCQKNRCKVEFQENSPKK